MSKKSEKVKNRVQPLEIIAFLVSVFYMQTVLTVAHHIAFRLPEPSGRTVESPGVPLLIIGLLLVGYNFFKEGRLGILNTVSLTILVIASIFWLSGLRANFFF